MANLVKLRQAVDEFHDAIAWYGLRDARLSDRFRAAVDRTVSAIAAGPTHFAWVDDDFRFAKVADFPYLVVYHEIGPDTYEIVAISHTSRDPDYWRTRVPGGE